MSSTNKNFKGFRNQHQSANNEISKEDHLKSTLWKSIKIGLLQALLVVTVYLLIAWTINKFFTSPTSNLLYVPVMSLLVSMIVLPIAVIAWKKLHK
jgi:ABC-type Fe3+ transport system permease subunit